MGKGTATAAFLGYVGASIFGSPSALAQQPDQPIRFSPQKQLEYQVSNTPPDPNIACESLEKIAGRGWGKYHASANGEVSGWGVLSNGLIFCFGTSLLDKFSLTIYDNSRPITQTLSFSDGSGTFGTDLAYVNGGSIVLGEGFYEAQASAEPWDRLGPEEKLRRIFSSYSEWLSLGEVRQKAKERASDDLNGVLERFNPER